MRENQLLEMIESYLNGEMTVEESAQFDALRKKDATIDAKIAEHKEFTGLLKQYNERLSLQSRLDEIHDEIDVHTLKDDLMAHPSWIVQLWRHHHSKISVAASIAIIAILLTLYFTGDLSNRDPRFVQLKQDVEFVKKEQARLGVKTDNIIRTRKSDGIVTIYM